MQNTDGGLAPLVNCSVCSVADMPEPKIQRGLAEAGGARLAGLILGLSGQVSLGRAGPRFRPVLVIIL